MMNLIKCCFVFFIVGFSVSIPAAQKILQKSEEGVAISDAPEPHHGCNFFEDDMKAATQYTEQLLRSGSRVVETETRCEDGFASQYPCKDVHLLSHISVQQLGFESCADIWGWTDTNSGREFAIIGANRGTAYVEITDAANPIYLGSLKLSDFGNSPWIDIKIYQDHAYIVSESVVQGLQIFNLAENLLSATPNTEFVSSAHYDGFGSAHNIAINEDTGFAYVVGSTFCNQGLYMLNLAEPLNVEFAGCYGGDGYTHDVQCVVYNGADSRYVGREICFASNENSVSIINVSNKDAPVLISRTKYRNARYIHQGWLTEDHQTFVFGDELDEKYNGVSATTTYFLDVKSLSSPSLSTYSSPYTGNSIDHNLYIKGNLIFQANYRSGLRILEANDFSSGDVTEVAFFDIYPEDDATAFNGAWSVYPYFPSGKIIVSGIEQGLFVLETSDTFSPSLPVPRNGGAFDCFSSVATAVVKGKGETQMSMIETGDQVLTGTGNYEIIYAIDHRHPTKSTEFIQIHSSPVSKQDREEGNPLEISSRHMLFLENNANPVPANTVKVGDRIATLDGARTVQQLSTVYRLGVYNPLTADGTIVVNGIVSSTYSSFSSNNEWIEVGRYKLMTHQRFFDTVLQPYRYICTTFSLELCKTSNEKLPISNFAASVYTFISQQNEAYRVTFLSLVVLVVHTFDFMHQLYSIAFIAMLIATCATLTKKEVSKIQV